MDDSPAGFERSGIILGLSGNAIYYLTMICNYYTGPWYWFILSPLLLLQWGKHHLCKQIHIHLKCDSPCSVLPCRPWQPLWMKVDEEDIPVHA